MTVGIGVEGVKDGVGLSQGSQSGALQLDHHEGGKPPRPLEMGTYSMGAGKERSGALLFANEGVVV